MRHNNLKIKPVIKIGGEELIINQKLIDNRKRIVKSEASEEVLTAVYKHTILTKIMEVYGFVLRDNLPNHHITNKSEAVIKSCKVFYSAFDRKIPVNGVEVVENMSMDYYDAFDTLISLPPDEFIKAKIYIQDMMANWRKQNQGVIKVVEING